MNPQTIALLKRRLEEAERNMQLMRQLLGDDAGESVGLDNISAAPRGAVLEIPTDGRVIIGEFDGEHMKGEDGQLYPVPANYASKSKVVEGDRLKLTIKPDGAFVYKQIAPVERRRVRGIFDLDDQGHYVVRTDEKEYRLLLASVTFYHLEVGDDVTILLPEGREAHWGAVEHALKKSTDTEPPAAT